GERARARGRRPDAAALVGRAAAPEVAGVGAQAGGEPVDRLLRRARLAALDLADVLLGEALAGELALRQARGHAQLAQALADAVRRARPFTGAGTCGRGGHGAVPGSLDHTSPVSKLSRSDIPQKGHVLKKSEVKSRHPQIT